MQNNKKRDVFLNDKRFNIFTLFKLLIRQILSENGEKHQRKTGPGTI